MQAAAAPEIDSDRFSGEAVGSNMRAMQTRRVLVSLVAGGCAGALNVQSWHGALFFLFAQLLFSAIQAAVMRGRVSDYFMSEHGIVSEGIAAGLLSYVLTWAMMFNFVHVF